MSDEREPLWSDQRIRDRYHALVPSEADMGEMEYWNVLRDVGERVSYELRDEYEAALAALRQENEALRAQLASRDTALAAALATNQRNVEDATRIIRANDGGIHLAHISLVEWGKCNKRIAELEAQLAQTWQPLPISQVIQYNGEWPTMPAEYANDELAICRLVTQEPTP